MKVVISNGVSEADYIIKMYKNKKNKLIVINDDYDICNKLSKNNSIDVIYGNSCKEYDLHLASIDNADLFIALSQDDIKNYIACKMAKKLFNVKRTIAIVSNPKNVNVFKTLGVDYSVSSTYLLAQSIKNEDSMENMIKTLSLADDNVLITEVVVNDDFLIIGKTLKEIEFPRNSILSCIYRYPHVIIPNGNSEILKNDKLYIVSSKESKDEVLKVISRRIYE